MPQQGAIVCRRYKVGSCLPLQTVQSCERLMMHQKGETRQRMPNVGALKDAGYHRQDANGKSDDGQEGGSAWS